MRFPCHSVRRQKPLQSIDGCQNSQSSIFRPDRDGLLRPRWKYVPIAQWRELMGVP